ncbi:hypothetical protein CALCODRAFT_304257 [Calocera cornea HHB12733]|uniref:Uncharacterized protein n=1 Tax=Calocera cornea HHB12733 TaxID=1353952 RepID=A0A165JL04_9BASI|nr:hypothetical protein CALCODRAFT_304257 [Calocera cornea HHB12733]
MSASTSTALVLQHPPPPRHHSRSSSASAQSRPACLIDIFTTPPTRLARASVDYSVASYSTASTPSLASAGENSLSSSLSSLQSFLAAASLPTPPPLSRAMSQPTKRRPSNPPSSFQQAPATAPQPSRCERLLLATLQRAEAAEEAIRHREQAAAYSPPSTPPFPSPRSSTSKDDDDTDWLAEIAEQTCMRPSRRSPAEPGRVGRTSSIVHVSRSPSPGKMSKMTRKKEQELKAMLQAEKERTGHGATFGPMPDLVRSDSFASSTEMRKSGWMSISPSPTGQAHADWPWEPTSPASNKSSHATATPRSPDSKPTLSRAHTSPAAPTLRRATTTVTRSTLSRPHKTASCLSGTQPITPPPSPPFDAHSTALLLKNREGYVSFRDLEGLGAPADEDEHDDKDGDNARGRPWWIPIGWTR